MANALGIAQFGGTAPTAKPWKASGIRTAKRDVDLVARRLTLAQKHYEAHYGRPKK